MAKSLQMAAEAAADEPGQHGDERMKNGTFDAGGKRKVFGIT